MAWKMIALATAALAAGCNAEPTAPAHNEAAAAAPADNETAAAATADPIEERFDQTMSGQPLIRPQEPFELLVTRAEFSYGDVITCHKHIWPRYVYLQQGSLRVTNRETGRAYEFSAGPIFSRRQILVESTDQWHEGLVTSREQVILVAFEQVPPGQNNRIPCSAEPGR